MRLRWQSTITVTACITILAGLTVLWWQPVHNFYSRQQGQRQNHHLLQVARQNTQRVAYSFDQPQRLRLPRLAIDLPIMPGHYNATTQKWTLNRHDVFLMQPTGAATATPIMYGHDIPGVFIGLGGVAPEEILEITFKDGRVYQFTYQHDVIVAPTDTTVLDKKVPRSVFLMTCTGAHFEVRRVLQFTFIGQKQVPQGMGQKSTHD
jgi:sortase (surface protein transpeptidase)